MGYFTWTLANRQLRKLSWGGYAANSILCYGTHGVVVCPDNTHIVEPHYDGYGEFNGHDVYELVVDWNKDELLNIMKIPEIANDSFFTDELKAFATAFATDDDVELDRLIKNVQQPYLAKEWKRNIGIAISCEHNHLIPYPIKIVNTKRNHKKYEDLPPSISTQ